MEKCFYFNYILFLPIWIVRQAIKVFKLKLDSENELNPSWINRLLTKLFSIDIMTAEKLNPPFGVSLLVIVRKLA